MMKNVAMLLSLLVIFSFLFQVAVEMRDFGEPHEAIGPDGETLPEKNETTDHYNYMDDHMIEEGQNETGSNNIVTGVVFDYRGLDTLGEATVLFTAVCGVFMMFQRKIKLQKEHDKSSHDNVPGEGGK